MLILLTLLNRIFCDISEIIENKKLLESASFENMFLSGEDLGVIPFSVNCIFLLRVFYDDSARETETFIQNPRRRTLGVNSQSTLVFEEKFSSVSDYALAFIPLKGRYNLILLNGRCLRANKEGPATLEVCPGSMNDKGEENEDEETVDDKPSEDVEFLWIVRDFSKELMRKLMCDAGKHQGVAEPEAAAGTVSDEEGSTKKHPEESADYSESSHCDEDSNKGHKDRDNERPHDAKDDGHHDDSDSSRESDGVHDPGWNQKNGMRGKQKHEAKERRRKERDGTRPRTHSPDDDSQVDVESSNMEPRPSDDGRGDRHRKGESGRSPLRQPVSGHRGQNHLVRRHRPHHTSSLKSHRTGRQLRPAKRASHFRRVHAVGKVECKKKTCPYALPDNEFGPSKESFFNTLSQLVNRFRRKKARE